MTIVDVTILEQHMDLLRPLLPGRDAPEAAAYMLLGSSDIAKDPWTGVPRLRLVTHRVVDIPAAEKISASPMHVTWSTTGFMRLLGDALITGKVPAIVHTHPGSYAFFSEQDDRNERELARTAKLKGVRGLVSIVLGGDGSVCARIWLDGGGYLLADAVQVVGGRFARHSRVPAEGTVSSHLDRQRRLQEAGATAKRIGAYLGILGNASDWEARRDQGYMFVMASDQGLSAGLVNDLNAMGR